MAVTCVHDFILAVLSDRPELAYFHVNELLCKAFENMLCLEMCDGDVQDQVRFVMGSSEMCDGIR
jgi:brefeldin A-inhibited guanine nucleotide-exchange protein 3